MRVSVIDQHAHPPSCCWGSCDGVFSSLTSITGEKEITVKENMLQKQLKNSTYKAQNEITKNLNHDDEELKS